MKLLAVILLVALAGTPAIFASPALSATATGRSNEAAADSSKQDLSVLPTAFAGWEISGSVRRGSDADTIDHAQSAALREYGFTGYEIATYTQGNRKLSVRAARFRMPREPRRFYLLPRTGHDCRTNWQPGCFRQ